MERTILIAALNKYAETYHDKLNNQASDNDLQFAAEIVSKAIDELIQIRLWQEFEKRSDERSKRKVALMEKLNEQVQLSCSDIKSLLALSTAPPPTDIEKYKEWYDTDRAAAIKI